MPFGLTNAPSVSRRLINYAYFNDILIPSTSFSDGLKSLELVLEHLRAARCYLDHVISGEGIRPGAKKIKAVPDFPRSATHQLFPQICEKLCVNCTISQVF